MKALDALVAKLTNRRSPSSLPSKVESVKVDYDTYAAAARDLNELSLEHELGRLSGLSDRVAALVAVVAALATTVFSLTLSDSLKWLKGVPVFFQALAGLYIVATLGFLAAAIWLALDSISNKELQGLPKGEKVFEDLKATPQDTPKATTDLTIAHHVQVMRDSHSRELDRRFKSYATSLECAKRAVILVAVAVALNTFLSVIISHTMPTEQSSSSNQGDGASASTSSTPVMPEGPTVVAPASTVPQTINQGGDIPGIIVKESPSNAPEPPK